MDLAALSTNDDAAEISPHSIDFSMRNTYSTIKTERFLHIHCSQGRNAFRIFARSLARYVLVVLPIVVSAIVLVVAALDVVPKIAVVGALVMVVIFLTMLGDPALSIVDGGGVCVSELVFIVEIMSIDKSMEVSTEMGTRMKEKSNEQVRSELHFRIYFQEVHSCE
jgi:hypothetical protein